MVSSKLGIQNNFFVDENYFQVLKGLGIIYSSSPNFTEQPKKKNIQPKIVQINVKANELSKIILKNIF